MRESRKEQWLRVAGDQVVLKGDNGGCYQWKTKRQCSRGHQGSFWHDNHELAKSTPKTAPSSEPPTPRGRSASRKRNLRGRSPSGKTNRQPCIDFLQGSCTKLLCDYWHPPECQLCQSETGCKFGDKCSFPHWKVQEQPSKKPKKGGDKSAAAIVKDVWQLGCVSQDVEPSESSAIFRKGTKVLGSTRRVWFTKAALRQANIREHKGPSLGKFQVKVPHQRSPCALKFEGRSQEEMERQERWARGDAWKLAKKIWKLKETDKATFCSPANEWSLPAASTTEPEEREFCRGLLSKYAYGQQVRPKLCRIRYCKSFPKSDDGGNSQRRGAKRRRGNSACQGVGFLRDSNASRRYTGSSFIRKSLRRSREKLPLDQWSETTTHQKWQKDRMQHGELHPSLSLVYRRPLQAHLHPHLLQLHRRKP